jgi:hypothetical protein
LRAGNQRIAKEQATGLCKSSGPVDYVDAGETRYRSPAEFLAHPRKRLLEPPQAVQPSGKRVSDFLDIKWGQRCSAEAAPRVVGKRVAAAGKIGIRLLNCGQHVPSPIDRIPSEDAGVFDAETLQALRQLIGGALRPLRRPEDLVHGEACLSQRFIKQAGIAIEFLAYLFELC